MWPDCARDPEGLALLQAAVSRPREHTPRLMLADWLQERGEEEVAGAIRESIRERDWVAFSNSVSIRWVPLNVAVDGWLGVHRGWPPPEGTLESQWLTSLDLKDTPVTDAGLRELAPLQNLTTLDLSRTEVTDAGLRELAPLQNLTTLDLSWTEVTNAGLRELAPLQNLTKLLLDRKRVTDAGVSELQQALPKCWIIR